MTVLLWKLIQSFNDSILFPPPNITLAGLLLKQRNFYFSSMKKNTVKHVFVVISIKYWDTEYRDLVSSLHFYYTTEPRKAEIHHFLLVKLLSSMSQ